MASNKIPMDSGIQDAILKNQRDQAARLKPGSAPPVIRPGEIMGAVSMDEGLASEIDSQENSSPEWDEELHGPKTVFAAGSENLSTFLARINEAKLNGDECLETTQRIFDYYTRKKPTPYLVYEGIKVFVVGTKERILREEAMSIDDRLRMEQEASRLRSGK